jgi:hypothetical protein
MSYQQMIPGNMIPKQKKTKTEAMAIIRAHVAGMPTIPESTQQYIDACEQHMAPNVWFHFMPIHPQTPEAVLKQVIGRDGCYFIRTTEECGLNFIWHNRARNSIEFWGPRVAVDYGVNAIMRRFQTVSMREMAKLMTGTPETQTAPDTTNQ